MVPGMNRSPAPPPLPTGGPGSQRALREANEQRVLSALRTGVHSQAELVRVTGLSPSTVSVTVNRLHERRTRVLETGTSNGRRAVLVRTADRSGLAAGVDIGRTHVRILVGRTIDDVVADREVALMDRHLTRRNDSADRRSAGRDCPRHGAHPDDISCVGVGLPGPVNAADRDSHWRQHPSHVGQRANRIDARLCARRRVC